MSARSVLLDQDAFRTAARAGQAAGAGVTRSCGKVVGAVDGKPRVCRFVFSDGSVDRMGDRIDPAGWETQEFEKNPVALWAHDSNQPPIGRVIAVWSDGTRLLGDIEFIPAETYDFADLIYRLVVGKWLNAVSVGFLPIDYKFADDDEGRPWGIDFQRQSLLEISVCPVPANANALIEARAKGIVTRADLRRLCAAPADDGYRRRLAVARARKAQLELVPARNAVSDTPADLRARAAVVRARFYGPALEAPIDAWTTPDELRARARAVRGLCGLKPRIDPRAIVANAAWRLRG